MMNNSPIPTSAKKIPVNLVTGFLGSGKTTLVRDLLRENQGRKKIAVLMNELGEIAIDAKLLEGFSAEMYELADGCICCSVNQDFIATLDELAAKLSPDLIIIETTGAANPMSIIYSLLNPNLVLDAVITTVDVENFMRLKAEADVAEDQVAAADAIVITKSDLASTAKLDAVKIYLAANNTHAQIFLRSETPLALIFGVSYPAREVKPGSHSHSDHDHHLETDGIETFRFTAETLFDLERLQSQLESLPSDLWRLKGFIKLAGRAETFILNFAYGRYTIEDYAGDSQAAACDVVFIGKRIIAEREHLTQHLQAAAPQQVR